MPVMINPRRKKRKKVKRRKTTRKRKRNPFDASQFGRTKKRKKATKKRKTTKRRKVTKRRKITKRRKVTKTPKRRKPMAKKRKRRKARKTLPLYVQFRKKGKRKANPKRRKRRKRRNPKTYTLGSRRKSGKRVRRGKYKAYVTARANPAKRILNDALMFGVGMLGNTFLSGILSRNLGGQIGFLSNGVVPSAAITVLSYLLFGKKQPKIIAGSVVATAFEVVKLVLPVDIKEMVGLGGFTQVLPGQEVYEALPGVGGFADEGMHGFASPYSGIAGVEEYMGDVEQYPGGTDAETTLQDEEFIGM